MYFKDKNILLISPEDWGHVFVSKHHYATHLAKCGANVWFLNPPSQSEGVTDVASNLHIVDYTGFLPGLRLYPVKLQRFCMGFVYKKIQALAGAEFDIVWSFDNSVFFDFGVFPSDVLKISHIVDLNMDFEVKKAATSADLCFCTSDLISKKLGRYSDAVYNVGHGFNRVEVRSNIVLPGENSIKALYLGNLAMPALDWQLLYLTAEEFTNVDFVFIGPGEEAISEESEEADAKLKTMALKNVYWLPSIPADMIPSYLKNSDLAIVCYREHFHEQQSNPHKILEYLGSGIPVVSTFTEEYEHSNLLYMSHSNSEFKLEFQRALDALNTGTHSSTSYRQVQFAKANTYDRKLKKIEQIILRTGFG